MKMRADYDNAFLTEVLERKNIVGLKLAYLFMFLFHSHSHLFGHITAPQIVSVGHPHRDVTILWLTLNIH